MNLRTARFLHETLQENVDDFIHTFTPIQIEEAADRLRETKKGIDAHAADQLDAANQPLNDNAVFWGCHL